MQENYKTNVKAILSLVLSILSIVCCCLWYVGFVIGIVAVILGILAVRGDNPRQKDAGIAGIVVGSVGVALGITMAVITIMLNNAVSDTGVTAMAVFSQFM